MKVCAEEGFPIDGADLQERITTMSGLGKDLIAEEKAEGLESLIRIMKSYISSPEEMYEKIKSDDYYSDVSFDTVKKMFEEKK